MLRFVIFCFAALIATPLAAELAMTSRVSQFSVTETADRLVKAVEGKGLKIAARIDHAAAAKSAGLELRPTVLVMFGNPKLGTPLMQGDQRVGVELPVRVLVWEDEAGKVRIGYTPPAALLARYKVKAKQARDGAAVMARAIGDLVKEAAGGT